MVHGAYVAAGPFPETTVYVVPPATAGFPPAATFAGIVHALEPAICIRFLNQLEESTLKQSHIFHLCQNVKVHQSKIMEEGSEN